MQRGFACARLRCPIGVKPRVKHPVTKHRRRRVRWPWLLPVGLVVGSLLFLRTDLAARIGLSTLRAALTSALGEEVTIGGISVSYLPLEVGLEGVLIAGREDGARIASARSIRARLGVKDWRAGLIRLSIDTPDIQVHLDDDGLREFRDMVRRPGAAPPADAFPWHELVVENGHFLLEGDDLRVELSDLDVVPEVGGRSDVAFASLTVDHAAIHENVGPTRFKRALLAPNRLELPAVDVRSDHLSVDGHVNIVFDGPLVGDLTVRASLPGFTTHPTDARRYVDGTLDLDVSLGGTVSEPAVTAAVSTQNIVAWRISSAGNPVALALGDLVGEASFSGGVASIGPLRMPWGEGEVGVAARIEVATKAISLDVTAESIQLGPVLQAAGAHMGPWVNFLGDVEAHATGTISPLSLHGPFEVSGTNLVVRKGRYDGSGDVLLQVPRGRLGGELTLDAKHIVLDASDVRFGASRGSAVGDIGFAADGPLRVETRFESLDLSWLQPLGGAGLGGIAKLDGRLSGPFSRLSAEATLAVTNARVLDRAIADRLVAKLDSPDLVHLDFTELHGEVGRSHYLGSVQLAFLREGLWLDTTLLVPEARVSELSGIFTDLPGIDAQLTGNLVLAGQPRRLSGEVRFDLKEIEVYGESFADGGATAWMDDGVLTVSDLVLARGKESIVARGSIGRGYAMNIEVLSDGVRLERLDAMADSPLLIEGDLLADIQVSGTLFRWQPSGRLVLQGARFGGRPIAPSAVRFGTSREGEVHFFADLLAGAAEAEGNLQLYDEQPYDIHTTLRDFPLEVLYPVGADGSPITARVSGEIDLAGHFGENPTPVDIDARFPDVRMSWSNHELRNEEEWLIAVHGRSVQVPGVSLTDGARTRVGFEGWTTADGRAAFRSGGTVNLDLLRAVAPGVSFADGIGTIDVQIGAIEGSPAEIRLTAKDATLRTDWFPRPFNQLEFDLLARADGYRFDRVQAEVGGGDFRGGGTIAAVAWRPTRYELFGSLVDTRVQYLDYLPPIQGNADLRFDGPVNDLLLSGTIEIAEMQFRERIDWESKILALQSSRLTDGARAEGNDLFSMDLTVNADNTVRLRNNIADADASANLRIVGDTARPGMMGDITIAGGGRMYLQDREFDIARGEIRYRDPYSFDPDLDIQLETDVRSREQAFHVYYGISGPFSEWSTTTSADPYLSQADINTLLLFGMTREEFEQYGGIAASALAAQATDLVAAQVATPTQLLDRWSLASGISARGLSTLDSDWRVQAEKDALGFTFIGEIDLGDGNWYAGVERRISKSFFANVYGTSREEGRALSVATAWGTELKYRWELD